MVKSKEMTPRPQRWTNFLDQVLRGCHSDDMTIQVNIAEAKAKLSELVARAEAGEDVVLARNGKAAVKLTAMSDKPKRKRTPGAWAKCGPMEDPDLFLRPDPDLVAAADASDEDDLYR